MEVLGLDVVQVAVTASAGLVGAVLTYLATRRQHDVSERTVYLTAVEHLTEALRSEIERVNVKRTDLLARIATLEQRNEQYESAERDLRRRVAELEDRERRLLARIEQLEQENDTLKRRLDS